MAAKRQLSIAMNGDLKIRLSEWAGAYNISEGQAVRLMITKFLNVDKKELCPNYDRGDCLQCRLC